jgi:hypothetical protein
MPHDSPLIPEPFALRPRPAAAYAGVCLTTINERVRTGVYDSYVEGGKRYVLVESMKRHQQQQYEASRNNPRPARPLKPGPGRPRKTDKS